MSSFGSYYEKILATGEVKCIDEEVPFEIPQGWEWERIGNLFETTSGSTPLSRNPDYYKDGCINWIRTTDLNNGTLCKAEIQITAKACSDYNLTILPQNSVCVAMYGGAGTIGKHSLLCLDTTINQSVCAIQPNGYCNMDYVHTFIEYQRPYWMEFAAGSRKDPNINQLIIKHCFLPIPPQKEQVRIVEKLSLLNPHIVRFGECQIKLEHINKEILDLLKKSILQEAIQGKLVPQIAEEGTAQELLEQIKAEKQKLVKEGKLKKSALSNSVIFRGDDNKYYEQIGKKCLDITEQIPFEIPSNWEWCRVRNVSNSYIGLTYKPTDIDEKGTIVLRSCNIRNGKLALDDIVRVSSSISEKLLIEENDIIICARNGSKRLVGKSALIRNLPEPMTFGAFMAICKTPIYEYMFAYLQSDLFFGQLRDVSNTTTINQLTQNKFNDFLIPIPPIREQERIAFKISQLFQKLR